jgi:hypothetical protein
VAVALEFGYANKHSSIEDEHQSLTLQTRRNMHDGRRERAVPRGPESAPLAISHH